MRGVGSGLNKTLVKFNSCFSMKLVSRLCGPDFSNAKGTVHSCSIGAIDGTIGHRVASWPFLDFPFDGTYACRNALSSMSR
jgi:hypothetical protein